MPWRPAAPKMAPTMPLRTKPAPNATRQPITTLNQLVPLPSAPATQRAACGLPVPCSATYYSFSRLRKRRFLLPTTTQPDGSLHRRLKAGRMLATWFHGVRKVRMLHNKPCTLLLRSDRFSREGRVSRIHYTSVSSRMSGGGEGNPYRSAISGSLGSILRIPFCLSLWLTSAR
jgi:hypothetical protein